MYLAPKIKKFRDISRENEQLISHKITKTLNILSK
jgi:hypothetical protein